MSDHIIEHLTTKHGPGSREPIRPRYLVIHDTEGSMPGDLYWLADAPAAEAPVSVHYLIIRQGLVYQVGRESWSMWHAGRTCWTPRDQGIASRDSLNRDSHGIELVHRSGETYPPAQRKALDQLIAELHQRHQYWGERPLGHREIAYPRGRKSDPEIDLKDYIYTAVEHRMKGDAVSTTNDELMTYLEQMQKDIDLSHSGPAPTGRRSLLLWQTVITRRPNGWPARRRSRISSLGTGAQKRRSPSHSPPLYQATRALAGVDPGARRARL